MQRNKSGRWVVILAVALLLSFASCNHDKKEKIGRKEQEQSHSSFARDWNRFPAIIARTTSAEVIALGDVQEATQALASLLINQDEAKGRDKTESYHAPLGSLSSESVPLSA